MAGFSLLHLLDDRLGRDAEVHHPDPLGFAVKLLDFLQELFQLGLVARVPRQNFISQGIARG
jgi:hypothetical protein